MKDMHYVLENFFTHKDYLVPGNQIPGTMFTPLHLIYAVTVLTIIVSSAIYISRHQKALKPVLATVWALMVVWEFAIGWFDSTQGKVVGFDLLTGLSLYPCSLYLYTTPFLLWGRGKAKQAAGGYLCTLGLLGAVINLLYPIMRLNDYSCISFAGMHTYLFHGAMFFTYLTVILSGYHRYDQFTAWQDLFLPCVPSLLLSIPANLLNYTIGSDYMYFHGDFPIVAWVFGATSPILITLVLYAMYILIPALFYLPAYLSYRRQEKREAMLALYTADF